jgi:prepilin-type processing-associated H-X9-DG protein
VEHGGRRHGPGRDLPRQRRLAEIAPLTRFNAWNGAPQLAQWIASGRHKGGANYLYLDGHVKWGRFEQVLPHQFLDHLVLLQPRTY